jgi:hypothetical protein
MFGFLRRKKQANAAEARSTHQSLEGQLEVLRECGIRMLPGIAIEHFLMSWDRENYESDPYMLALVKLGGEIEEAPWGRRLSHNVWHFDTECVEGPGSYVRIAERMRELAQGDLPIIDPKDQINLAMDGDEEDGKGTNWVEFVLDGQTVRWNVKVNDDWVDSGIMSRFAELLKERGTSRRFTYLDIGGGQDCLIGCASSDQLALLRQRTGLDFLWLT